MPIGAGETKYSVVLWSVEEENIGNIIAELAKALEVDQKKASMVVQTTPIVLIDKLNLEGATRVKTNLGSLLRIGADIRITEEGVDRLPKLSWPVKPRFVQLIEEVARKRRITNVFRCPSCGEVLGVQIVPTKRRQAAAAPPPPAVPLSPKQVPPPPTFSHLLTAAGAPPIAGYIPPPPAASAADAAAALEKSVERLRLPEPAAAGPSPSDTGALTAPGPEAAEVDRIFSQEIDLGEEELDPLGVGGPAGEASAARAADPTLLEGALPADDLELVRVTATAGAPASTQDPTIVPGSPAEAGMVPSAEMSAAGTLAASAPGLFPPPPPPAAPTVEAPGGGTIAGESAPGTGSISGSGSLDDVVQELDRAFPSGEATGPSLEALPADEEAPSGPRGPRPGSKPRPRVREDDETAPPPEEQPVDLLKHLPPRGAPPVPRVGPKGAEPRPSLRSSFPGYRAPVDEATAYSVVVDRGAAGRLDPNARRALAEVIAGARRVPIQEGSRLAGGPAPIVVSGVSKDQADRVVEALRSKSIPARLLRRE